MAEDGILEPSFADAITVIEQAEELPPSKRTHWPCSLRKIAQALDRPPQSIPARWGAVALKVNQLHHANSGVEWKTLANHKSNTKAALLWFRSEQGLAPRGAPLRPHWKKLRQILKDPSRLTKLSGLIRYCSLKGIEPSAVDQAIFDSYMSYRKETTALAVDIKARRAIARSWNASRSIEGWPQQQLIEPPLKTKEGPRWEDFPSQLQADVASHLRFLATHRRSLSGKHLRPCKASTLRTRRMDLISFAKKVVRLGIPIDHLSSLSVLLAPGPVDLVLDNEWERNGIEPKTSTIDLAKKLYAVARSANCLTEDQLLFRTAGVTTLATRAGDKPHAGAALLHHRPGPVTQESYNRASCLGAGKALAAVNQGGRPSRSPRCGSRREKRHERRTVAAWGRRAADALWQCGGWACPGTYFGMLHCGRWARTSWVQTVMLASHAGCDLNSPAATASRHSYPDQNWRRGPRRRGEFPCLP
jgi:hypothetical protein